MLLKEIFSTDSKKKDSSEKDPSHHKKTKFPLKSDKFTLVVIIIPVNFHIVQLFLRILQLPLFSKIPVEMRKFTMMTMSQFTRICSGIYPFLRL